MENIHLIVPEGPLRGTVRLPASKSICNRVLLIRALSEGEFPVFPLSDADDTRLMLAALEDEDGDIYVKNAGTAMRFLTAYFAATGKDVVLRGSSRMNERPIAPLVEALRELGAEIHYLENPGYPPLHIEAKPLQGGEVRLPSGQSSQFASALLMIGPTLKGGLTLRLEGEAASRPYLQMTLGMMAKFAAPSIWTGNTIHVPESKYLGAPYRVEADWSAASYLLALASLFPGSDLFLPDLFESSMQGDSVITDWAEGFGLELTFEEGGLRVRSNGQQPDFFEKNMIDCPDLIPTLVCWCCALEVPFRITGTRTLQYKESDRARVLQTELAKLGYRLAVSDNEISYVQYQPETAQGKVILKTHDDHRMAMGFGLLAAKHPEVVIENPIVVEKSFPAYWEVLASLGFSSLSTND